MKKLSYIIPILIVVYFSFYFFVQNTGAEQGDIAPDFEAELIDGSSFKLSDLRGKYVVLEFWASWCGPCIRTNKNLVTLYSKYPDKFEVVTIALEKGGDRWKSASKRVGFNWKYQIVEKHKLVMLSEIARKYGVSEIPAKFLISPEGKLLKELSFEDMDTFFDKL